MEAQREQAQRQLREISNQYSNKQAQLSGNQARLEQLRQRSATIANELSEAQQQLDQATTALQTAQQAYQRANDKIAQHSEQKNQLLQQRDNHRQQLEIQRQQARADKLAVDELQVRLNTSRSQSHYVRQAITRAEKQLADLTQRRDNITQTLVEITAPLSAWQENLDQLLTQRLQNERELELARQNLNQIEHELQQQEKNRHVLTEAIEAQRQGLEQLRMQLQALQIHQVSHQEKITELGFVLEQMLTELPEDAIRNQWEEKVAQLESRIQRLGAINLAAIDEHLSLRTKILFRCAA